MNFAQNAALFGQIARYILESGAADLRKAAALKALYEGEVLSALSIIG